MTDQVAAVLPRSWAHSSSTGPIRLSEPNVAHEEKGDFVDHYITTLETQTAATCERLARLLDDLASFGCRLLASERAEQWTLEVPSDLLTWVKTGGLQSLLTNYRDAVRWTAPFRSSRFAASESFVAGRHASKQLNNACRARD